MLSKRRVRFAIYEGYQPVVVHTTEPVTSFSEFLERWWAKNNQKLSSVLRNLDRVQDGKPLFSPDEIRQTSSSIVTEIIQELKSNAKEYGSAYSSKKISEFDNKLNNASLKKDPKAQLTKIIELVHNTISAGHGMRTEVAPQQHLTKSPRKDERGRVIYPGELPASEESGLHNRPSRAPPGKL